MKSAFYFCLGWGFGVLLTCWMIGEYDEPKPPKKEADPLAKRLRRWIDNVWIDGETDAWNEGYQTAVEIVAEEVRRAEEGRQE